MENKLKELCDKLNDLHILQEKVKESLQAEIKDLKETLVMREECHKKQKGLFKTMTANAQGELNKARAVTSNLSEGMTACR